MKSCHCILSCCKNCKCFPSKRIDYSGKDYPIQCEIYGQTYEDYCKEIDRLFKENPFRLPKEIIDGKKDNSGRV